MEQTSENGFEKFTAGSVADNFFVRCLLPNSFLLLIDIVEHNNKKPAASSFVRYYKSNGAKNSVFAIIHGGYWKKKYGIDTSGVDSLVPHLLR